jgi:selenocysteine lyase/cysteine desulfurase
MDLVRTFLDGVSNIEGLTYYGPQGVKNRIGVFSVSALGFSPTELSKALEERFGILTRPGLHCAPLAHEAIGTTASGGTTRFSFGPFLTKQDIHFATNALADVANSRTHQVNLTSSASASAS